MVGAAPEPDWTTARGLGLSALGFSALVLLRLTLLDLFSKEGDLPRDLFGAPVAGLDDGLSL